jgi:uncharacterized protein (DUF952 family)
MTMIYHITTAADWEAAQAQGHYTVASLTSEGFIHCSKLEQVVATANRHYPGQRGLILLSIITDRVIAEIRAENLSGGSELFPHIYGPINLDAVNAVLPFEPGADGRFSNLPANMPTE